MRLHEDTALMLPESCPRTDVTIRLDAEQCAAPVIDDWSVTNPELSICIPTHHGRAAELVSAIDSVICQLDDDLRSRVEICITDNASRDATEQLVRERRLRVPGLITYQRHPRDLGVSHNLMSVMDLARGRWIWLFGSDDALEPGSIRAVLDLVASTPGVAGVSVSRRVYGRDLRFPLGLDEPKLLPGGSTTTLLTGSAVLDTVGLYAMYMSGHIVNAAAWRAARARLDPISISASVFPHGWVLTLLWSEGVPWLWDPAPRIRSRMGNSAYGQGRALDYARLLGRIVHDQWLIWETLLPARSARRLLNRLHDLVLPKGHSDNLVFGILYHRSSGRRTRWRLVAICARSFSHDVRFWRESLLTLALIAVGSPISDPRDHEIAEHLTRTDTSINPEREPLYPAAGATFMASFRLENTGTKHLRSQRRFPLNLGARWFDAQTGEPIQESERQPLGRALAPGASRRFRLRLCVPPDPGQYVLRVAPVIEGIGWFDDLRPQNGWSQSVLVTA